MQTIDIATAYTVACQELGLDPANTNHFILECKRQGRDPKDATMHELDRNGSELWRAVRKRTA